MLSHIKGSTCQESWPNILNAVNAGGGKLQYYSSKDTFHFNCSDGASHKTASETFLWIIATVVWLAVGSTFNEVQ